MRTACARGNGEGERQGDRKTESARMTGEQGRRRGERWERNVGRCEFLRCPEGAKRFVRCGEQTNQA